MNPLFPSMIVAEIFLFGFLLSGVLVDFKEFEKLPIEIASSLETIYEDAENIFKSKGAPPQAEQCMKFIASMANLILAWFNNKCTTDSLFESLCRINDFINPLESFSTPPAISRLKVEQNNLRKAIIRARMIRDTSFVSSAYAIAEALTLFTIMGFLLVNIEPLLESLFFIGIISYLTIYMVLLIHDLDNPFDYIEGLPAGEEASLLPIEDAYRRIQTRLDKLVK